MVEKGHLGVAILSLEIVLNQQKRGLYLRNRYRERCHRFILAIHDFFSKYYFPLR